MIPEPLNGVVNPADFELDSKYKVNNHHSSDEEEILQDSLEWGSGSKDCKAKVYIDFKKMSKSEIMKLIDDANLMRKYALGVNQ